MNLQLTIAPEASEELAAAAAWYESRRLGLGIEFLESLDVAFAQIERWPKAGATVPDVSPNVAVRRVPLGRFPYHVVYLEMAAEIRVLAIAHDRRRPGYWRGRKVK